MMAAIDRASVAEQIANRLRTAIERGSLKPNDRLIEQDISRTFSVSRGPVREAIRLLASDGVVVLRPNRGAIVASPTLDDVLEVYALRLSLGEIALALAAESGNVDDRTATTLHRLVDKLLDPKTQLDSFRMVEADLAFQMAAVRLSGLPRFTEAFGKTDTDIKIFVPALGIAYDSQDHAALAQRHKSLIEALQAGNAQTTANLWRTHISETVREFSRGFAQLERPELRELLTRGMAPALL